MGDRPNYQMTVPAFQASIDSASEWLLDGAVYRFGDTLLQAVRAHTWCLFILDADGFQLTSEIGRLLFYSLEPSGEWHEVLDLGKGNHPCIQVGARAQVDVTALTFLANRREEYFPLWRQYSK